MQKCFSLCKDEKANVKFNVCICRFRFLFSFIFIFWRNRNETPINKTSNAAVAAVAGNNNKKNCRKYKRSASWYAYGVSFFYSLSYRNISLLMMICSFLVQHPDDSWSNTHKMTKHHTHTHMHMHKPVNGQEQITTIRKFDIDMCVFVSKIYLFLFFGYSKFRSYHSLCIVHWRSMIIEVSIKLWFFLYSNGPHSFKMK